MPTTVEKWSIEGYIAVQLICCLAWRLGGANGFNPERLQKLNEGLTPETKQRLQATINRLQNEILSDINRAVHEDLPIFARMIPQEYRSDAWGRCEASLLITPHKMDGIISKPLQKALT